MFDLTILKRGIALCGIKIRALMTESVESQHASVICNPL